MKTIFLGLITLVAAVTIAQEIEPPRILGARIDRTNAGNGVIVAELHILHPEHQTVQVLQVSDGATNKIATVHNDRKEVIKWSVKLGGETNVFRVRALSHHEPPIVSEWGLAYTVIPAPRE